MDLANFIAIALLVGAEPSVTPPSVYSSYSSLEISGRRGIRIFGTCFFQDGVTEKKFDGVTPTEIALEVGVQKCSIASTEKKAKLKLRLFQNRKLILTEDRETSMSGIEISFPWGKKKK